MLALLYDIHGNLAALEAVLADAERAGAERYLLGGDLVAFGPDPDGTLARLRDLGDAATWIRGNTERWMVDPADAPEPMGDAARAAAEAVGDAAARELAGLPESAVVDDATIAWHASYRSDMEGVAAEADERDVALRDPGFDRMVVGHTHVQFLRELKDGSTVCNPGSVGVPLDGDRRAAWALLRDTGTIELRRVAYDADAAVAALRERFTGAWVDVVGGRMQRAAP